MAAISPLQTAPDELGSQATTSTTLRVVLPPIKKRKNTEAGIAIPAYTPATPTDKLLTEARRLLLQAYSGLKNQSQAEIASAIKAIDRAREEEDLPSLRQKQESWSNPTLHEQISTLQQIINIKYNVILSAVKTLAVDNTAGKITKTIPATPSTYAAAAAKAIHLSQEEKIRAARQVQQK